MAISVEPDLVVCMLDLTLSNAESSILILTTYCTLSWGGPVSSLVTGPAINLHQRARMVDGVHELGGSRANANQTSVHRSSAASAHGGPCPLLCSG